MKQKKIEGLGTNVRKMLLVLLCMDIGTGVTGGTYSHLFTNFVCKVPLFSLHNAPFLHVMAPLNACVPYFFNASDVTATL